MNYFQIVKKPVRSLMKVDAVEVVEGTKYLIDAEIPSVITVENETPYFGEPFDSFKYKIYNEDIVSVNTGNANINFKTNKIGVPPLITLVENLKEGEFFVFSDLVFPEEHFDKIVITNITGRGSWLYNGNPLKIGQTIFYFDLVDNLKFIANDFGLETNYSVLTWDTKNKSGVHGQANTITVNTVSDGAELSITGFDDTAEIFEGLEYIYYAFKVSKSFVGATYKLEIDPTLFPSLGVNPLDTIEFYEHDLAPYVIDTNTIHLRDSDLDENGETTVSVLIKKNTVTIVPNSILITLKEINGSTANINAAFDEITLLIPITPTP